MNIEPFTPESSYVKMKRFHAWVQTIVPFVYDNSLSFYEVIGKMAEYLNEIRDRQNQLSNLYDSLVAWCNDAIAEQTDFIQKFTENLRAEWNQFSEDMKNQFKQLSDEINQELTDFETKIQQQQNAFEEKINGQIETWQNEWNTYQTNLNEAWSEYQNTLNTAWSNYQNNLNTEWSDVQNEIDNYFENLDVHTELQSIISQMLTNGELAQIVSENLGTLIHLTSITTEPETSEIGDVYYNSTDKNFYIKETSSSWNIINYTDNYIFEYNQLLYDKEDFKDITYYSDLTKSYCPIYSGTKDNYYFIYSGTQNSIGKILTVTKIEIYKNEEKLYTLDSLNIGITNSNLSLGNSDNYIIFNEDSAINKIVLELNKTALLISNDGSFIQIDVDTAIQGIAIRDNILIVVNGANPHKIYSLTGNKIYEGNFTEISYKYPKSNRLIVADAPNRVFKSLSNITENSLEFVNTNITESNITTASVYGSYTPYLKNSILTLAPYGYVTDSSNEMHYYIFDVQSDYTLQLIPAEKENNRNTSNIVYNTVDNKYYCFTGSINTYTNNGVFIESLGENYFNSTNDDFKSPYDPMPIYSTSNGLFLQATVTDNTFTTTQLLYDGVKSNLYPLNYLTKEQADTYYQPIGDYVTEENANNTYLSKDDANNTYLSKTDASSTYLTQSNANATYLSKTDASSKYLTQANANTTYQTKSDMTRYVTSNVNGTQVICQNTQPSIPSSGQIIWIDTSDL